MKAAKKVFTQNDAVSLMNRHRAISFREVAKWIEETKPSSDYISTMLMEMADDADAQAMVVDLRDTL